MFIRSRKPSNASFIEVLETKQQTKKVERKVKEKKATKKEEEVILPLVEEALASVEE